MYIIVTALHGHGYYFASIIYTDLYIYSSHTDLLPSNFQLCEISVLIARSSKPSILSLLAQADSTEKFD